MIDWFARVLDGICLWVMECLPDNCQVCNGEEGGMLGNENIVDGVVMCDYCHAKDMTRKEKDGQEDQLSRDTTE